MGIKAQPYGGTAQKQKALLVMCRASDIIGPHKSFVQHSPCRTLFAYSLPVRTQLPVTPDIIGCLFSQCLMPWAQELDNHFKDLKEEQKTKQHPLNQIQEKATREILSSVESLQSNNLIKKRIEDLHDYYNLKKPLLVLDNACSFPERPEYTAEIPF